MSDQPNNSSSKPIQRPSLKDSLKSDQNAQTKPNNSFFSCCDGPRKDVQSLSTIELPFNKKQPKSYQPLTASQIKRRNQSPMLKTIAINKPLSESRIRPFSVNSIPHGLPSPFHQNQRRFLSPFIQKYNIVSPNHLHPQLASSYPHLIPTHYPNVFINSKPIVRSYIFRNIMPNVAHRISPLIISQINSKVNVQNPQGIIKKAPQSNITFQKDPLKQSIRQWNEIKKNQPIYMTPKKQEKNDSEIGKLHNNPQELSTTQKKVSQE